MSRFRVSGRRELVVGFFRLKESRFGFKRKSDSSFSFRCRRGVFFFRLKYYLLVRMSG